MYMHVLHGFSAASHYSFLTTRLTFKLRGLLQARTRYQCLNEHAVLAVVDYSNTISQADTAFQAP